MLDLFGVEIEQKELLRDKFMEIPFTTLSARGGAWQSRKQKWLSLGIKSELGRKGELSLAQGLNEIDPRDSYTGTSVFDSALTELMYYWFCPEQGAILDPFAGGSVRGIVATYLGYQYTGLELRQEQVDNNYEQAKQITPDNLPLWICGDSDKLLDDTRDNFFDFIFSCPPYMDLEVYSDLPDDLSTMSDDNFKQKYQSIIKKACNKLKSGGLACFVVGDVRDKNGYYKDFITITKLAFYEAGMKLYNEAILLENGLNTAAMRADKQFSANKKLVKVHQNILVFKKP